MKLYEKIQKIQKEIGKIEKDKENPYYNSRYFDINQLLAKLMPLAHNHDLIITQPITFIEGRMMLSTVLMSEDEKEVFTIPLPENSDPQKMGSAITYFRRYSLQSLFCLEAEDDDGNSALDDRERKIKEAKDNLEI